MLTFRNRRTISLCEGEQLPQSDIKSAGLKITLPRLKVLEVLEAADPHHLSAEDVYRKLIETDESVGLATVYRVLEKFEAASIVERHNFDDGHAVYELANETHHDHMVDVDTEESLSLFQIESKTYKEKLHSNTVMTSLTTRSFCT